MFSLPRKLVPKLVAPVYSIQSIQSAKISTSIMRLAAGGEMLEVGPYPRTQEERNRAAKKYCLIPEDYEPYEEGEGFGDYPKLKAIGGFNRDRYDDFDDPIDNRFYGEVFHLDADLYYWERTDPLAHEKPGLPLWLKAVIFFGAAGFLPSIFWLFNKGRININHSWKQRLYCPNQKYYEFPSNQ